MGDPKYAPRYGGFYHIDGYRVPDDEPLMVLRGKDIGALDAICEYIEMLEDQPGNEVVVSHLSSSLERLCAFYCYQMENPGLQSVGCSRRAHEGSARFLRRAADKLREHGYSFEAAATLREDGCLFEAAATMPGGA